jgi:hypothetical protein
MLRKLLILVLASLVVAYNLTIPTLKVIASQDDRRGLRVESSPSERRIALVIGNSTYKDSPLANPVNDARDMAAALRGLGFEVVFGENLSQNDMKRNIRAFGEKIRSGEVGLFYYAGHGVQVNGENYLIPVGTVITKEEEVEYEAVNVGFVLAQMGNARNKLNVIILDACRNNPFARSFRSNTRGLAYINAPSGIIIAYATAPGSVASDGDGRNGLYTQELLDAMRVPGLKLEDVFKRVRIGVQSKTKGKQIPWESSSLVDDFYFLSEDNNTGKNIPVKNKQNMTAVNEPLPKQPNTTSKPFNSIREYLRDLGAVINETTTTSDMIVSNYSVTNGARVTIVVFVDLRKKQLGFYIYNFGNVKDAPDREKLYEYLHSTNDEITIGGFFIDTEDDIGYKYLMSMQETIGLQEFRAVYLSMATVVSERRAEIIKFLKK